MTVEDGHEWVLTMVDWICRRLGTALSTLYLSSCSAFSTWVPTSDVPCSWRLLAWTKDAQYMSVITNVFRSSSLLVFLLYVCFCL